MPGVFPGSGDDETKWIIGLWEFNYKTQNINKLSYILVSINESLI